MNKRWFLFFAVLSLIIGLLTNEDTLAIKNTIAFWACMIIYHILESKEDIIDN